MVVDYCQNVTECLHVLKCMGHRTFLNHYRQLQFKVPYPWTLMARRPFSSNRKLRVGNLNAACNAVLLRAANHMNLGSLTKCCINGFSID